jgi:arginase
MQRRRIGKRSGDYARTARGASGLGFVDGRRRSHDNQTAHRWRASPGAAVSCACRETFRPCGRPPSVTTGTPTLVGIPYDASSSFLRGAAAAPPLIREALVSSATNRWSERLIDTGASGVMSDAGDLVLRNERGELPRIEEEIQQLLGDQRRPISLGGDHAISYATIHAVRQRAPKLTVLHFDAHPDLYPEFEGRRDSHACQFARLLEERCIDQLIQVGIRTMNDVQHLQAERFGVEVIDMQRWAAGDRKYTLQHPVYVSIDVDVFDPAFAPGVSHREPGGLDVRAVLTAIESIDQPIVGADIVEFNPSRDPVGLTAPVCAKLVKELVARMVTR